MYQLNAMKLASFWQHIPHPTTSITQNITMPLKPVLSALIQM